MNRIFHSIEEIQKFYLPKQTEKEKVARMTPQALGKWMAQKTLEKVFGKKGQKP